MIASLPGARLFCTVWAILASLREHLTCCCMCIVHLSMIALRYAKFGPLYVNGHIDYLLVINVPSEIIGKK